MRPSMNALLSSSSNFFLRFYFWRPLARSFHASAFCRSRTRPQHSSDSPCPHSNLALSSITWRSGVGLCRGATRRGISRPMVPRELRWDLPAGAASSSLSDARDMPPKPNLHNSLSQLGPFHCPSPSVFSRNSVLFIAHRRRSSTRRNSGSLRSFAEPGPGG